MKAKKTGQLFAFTLTFLMAATTVNSVSVNAGALDVELQVLLKSPVSKYLLKETQEGVRILSALTALGGGPEAEAMTKLLIGRLSTARSRFQILAAMAEGIEARLLLKQIATESLSIRLGETGTIEFIAENKFGYAIEKKAFLAEKPGQKMPGIDNSGKVLQLDANLMNSDLRFADLTKIDAPYSHFDSALLERATLENAKLNGASFDKADLRGASLRGAKLSGADLKSANLTNADLRGADLRGADLTGARIGSIGFEFKPAVKLEGAIIDAHTQLPEGLTVEQAQSLGAKLVTE